MGLFDALGSFGGGSGSGTPDGGSKNLAEQLLSTVVETGIGLAKQKFGIGAEQSSKAKTKAQTNKKIIDPKTGKPVNLQQAGQDETKTTLIYAAAGLIALMLILNKS